MWVIRKLTNTVILTDSEGIDKEIEIKGISGYYPICKEKDDADKIAEYGKYKIHYIMDEMPLLNDEDSF